MPAAMVVLVSGALSSGSGCMLFRSLDDLGDRERDRQQHGAGDGGPLDATLINPDASDAAGDAPTAERFCKGAHALCTDFDDGDLPGPFESASATGVALVTERALSLPRSLLASMPRRTDSTSNHVYSSLDFSLAGAWTRGRVAFDVFVEAPAWQSGDKGVALAVFLMRSDTSTTGTVFSLTQVETTVSVETAPPNYYAAPDLPLDRWAHVTFDIRTSGVFDYSIDGKTGSKTFVPVTPGTSPRASLGLGLASFFGPHPAIRVFYDNVTVDLE